MSFAFHPDAEKEFNQAIDYYEAIEPDLGFDFATEVWSAIERCAEMPLMWPVMDGDVRRSLVRRFPYGVLYSKERDGILIVAVMHLHRRPDYWKRRT